jgi:hypothetical protein
MFYKEKSGNPGNGYFSSLLWQKKNIYLNALEWICSSLNALVILTFRFFLLGCEANPGSFDFFNFLLCSIRINKSIINRDAIKSKSF